MKKFPIKAEAVRTDKDGSVCLETDNWEHYKVFTDSAPLIFRKADLRLLLASLVDEIYGDAQGDDTGGAVLLSGDVCFWSSAGDQIVRVDHKSLIGAVTAMDRVMLQPSPHVARSDQNLVKFTFTRMTGGVISVFCLCSERAEATVEVQPSALDQWLNCGEPLQFGSMEVNLLDGGVAYQVVVNGAPIDLISKGALLRAFRHPHQNTW